MRFRYRSWDGAEFPTQDHLQAFAGFMEFLLDYGDEALRALGDLEEDPEQRRIINQWIAEGLLEKIGVHFRLTPRAMNSLQRKAMMEIFRGLRTDARDGHETRHLGTGGEWTEGTRPYRFGDPPESLDLNATLRNALRRRPDRFPVPLREEDFEVRLAESRGSCSTVILLDMSGSMGRWNRFLQAKKCAMALYALIRQRFPLDTVDVVGFSSGAEIIPEHRLPLIVPKQVSLFDPVVRLRVPLSQLHRAPQHFTNLQMGLMIGRRILTRRGGVNRQMIIITDGQPTARLEGDTVHLTYPPDEATAVATLSEALVVSRQGVRLSTFALIDDYFQLDWVGFVDQLTRLTRGVSFYCTSGELGQCVMESYLSGRRTRAHLT